MDLRSIINTDAGDSSISKQVAPVTPVQTRPSHGFRDFSQAPQASPGKYPSQDYGTQPGGQYASPTTYQPQSYRGRPPPPPPIQAPPPQHELRSPARSYSAQSPYGPTPSSANSQYPFPQPLQTPQSPAQHHQYPSPFQQRESYSQSNPPPAHLQPQNSYSLGGSPAPQTPPIGMPGAPHPYLQRSHSSISTSTPTSANSQHQQYFGNQYSQESPVSATNLPPQQIPQQIPEHSRQHSIQSQPGTPLGPPLTQRQSSGAFQQPSSPYQQRDSQRVLSTASFSQLQQTSPAPPAPAAIQRVPSTPSAYDSQRTSTSERQRRSQSERERSLSVSPKTRLPSQPRGEITTPQSENGFDSSSKRKLEDREILIEQPRRMEHPQIRPEANGGSRMPSQSPQQPAKKRVRYTEPPIWAQSVRNKGLATMTKVNGKQPMQVAPAQAQLGPPAGRTEMNGNRQASPAVMHPVPAIETDPSLLLGQWEKSITGVAPQEPMSKMIADFLFLNVVNRNDLGELKSRGVEMEIEAKLGQLVDEDTNVRLQLPVKTQCIIEERQRMKFRSSMTEFQHRKLNEYLNAKVTETHPGNRDQPRRRVEIKYLHRRETDKFYVLSPAMIANLPGAMREQLNPRHTHKLRVTYDQKTNEILAAIVKCRITDLNIYNPQSPLDCRISINFEMKYDGDVQEVIENAAAMTMDRSPDRNKDRLSYSQSHYQIDLTQVTQTMGNRLEKEHELEIEISTEALRQQGQRAASGQPNEYVALIDGFLNNIRVLSREVPPPQ